MKLQWNGSEGAIKSKYTNLLIQGTVVVESPGEASPLKLAGVVVEVLLSYPAR